MHPLICELLQNARGTNVSGFQYRHQDKIKKFSLAEIVSLARRYSALICENSRPNSLVMLALRQGVSGPALFLACLFQGRIPAFVAHPSKKVRAEDFVHKMEALTGLIQPDCILCEDQDQEYFAHLKTKIIPVPLLPPASELDVLEIENPCFAQFSSGSTGIPKAMLYNLNQLQSHLVDFEKALNWEFEPSFISWLPLYHDMGLIACLLFPLFRGKPVHYLDPFEWVSSPASIFEDAQTFGSNVTWMPNFAYALLTQRCANLTIDLSGFYSLSSCAEPVMVNTVRDFYHTFKSMGLRPDALSVTYAMAENIFAMTHRVIDMRTEDWQEASHVSCGKPLSMTEIRIDHKNQNKIWIRSPYMLTSYWGSANILSPEGWFDTGDCGFIHKGELFVTGRATDMIIIHGVNIFPQSVETLVDTIPELVAGRNVCFARPDPKKGTEELIVLAETRCLEKRQELEFLIRETISQKLDLVPGIVRCVPYLWLRKTSSGKIARKPNLQKFTEAIARQCIVFGCSHVYALNRSDELYNQHSTAENVTLNQVPIASCLNIFSEPRLTQVRDALKSMPDGSLCVFLIGEQDIRTVMPFWQMHRGMSREEAAKKVVSLWNDYIHLWQQEFPTLELVWFFPPPPGEGLKPHPRFLARTDLGDEQYYHYLATQDERRLNAKLLRDTAKSELVVSVLDIWDQVLVSGSMEIRGEYIRDNSHLKCVKQLMEWALEQHSPILFLSDKTPALTQKRVVEELNISEEICALVRQHFSAPVEPVTNLLHVLNSVDIVRLLGIITDTYLVNLPSTWLNKQEIETPLLLSQWILKHKLKN